jgi:exonuclease III
MQSNDDETFDKTNITTKNVWNKQFYELKKALDVSKPIILGGDFNRPVQDIQIAGLPVFDYGKSTMNTNTTQGQIDGFFTNSDLLGRSFFDEGPIKLGFTDHVLVGHETADHFRSS